MEEGKEGKDGRRGRKGWKDGGQIFSQIDKTHRRLETQSLLEFADACSLDLLDQWGYNKRMFDEAQLTQKLPQVIKIFEAGNEGG